MRDLFRELPKVEIHLHLEGAIPRDALWELVQKYGGTSEVPTMAALKEKFRYRDFPHFIETWTWKNGFLREYEDFTFIASAVARDLAAQNIRYVEAFHSPGDFHTIHGLEVPRITEAISRGIAAHADEAGFTESDLRALAGRANDSTGARRTRKRDCTPNWRRPMAED